MKYILINAYFNKNLGDDMFVAKLLSRYSKRKFLLLTRKRFLITNKSRNIKQLSLLLVLMNKIINKVFKKELIIQHIKKKSEAIIRIGGSIFIQPSDWKEKNRAVKINHNNLFYIGCNYGPSSEKSFFSFVEQQIKISSDICFRDKYSYNLFSHLENVRYAPDVLWGYDYPEIIEGDGIGISVIEIENRPSLSRYADLYYLNIVKMINYFQSINKRVVLLGFCEPEGDTRAIKKIKSMLVNDNIEMEIYNGNIDKFLNIINSCDSIIATRFHAMIIGWALRKKVFPIIYSKKQTHVLDDMEFVGNKWDLLSGEQFNVSFNEMFGLNNIIYDEQLNRLKSESEKQFEMLDKFLKEEN